MMQSCMVYKKQPVSIEQASKINDRIIKIKTVDGAKHKFRWIDENEDNVVSIKKTKKTLIDIKKIRRIQITDPERKEVSLDSALNHNGEITIETAYEDYDFIKIKKIDNRLLGTSMTGKDTLKVVIPKNEIAILKVQNKGLSNTGNIFIGVGVILGITIWAITPIEIDPL